MYWTETRKWKSSLLGLAFHFALLAFCLFEQMRIKTSLPVVFVNPYFACEFPDHHFGPNEQAQQLPH